MKDFYLPPTTPDLLIDHPIFRDAYAIQIGLENETFDESSEALSIAQAEISSMYDQGSNLESVLNQRVLLTGDKLIIPKIIPDLGLGSHDLVTQNASAELTDGEVPEPIEGKFYGFCASTTVNENGTYSAHISYQVAVRSQVSFGSFLGTICATGRLSDSRLTFIKDDHATTFSEALNSLTDLSQDADTAVASSVLEDLLTPEDNNQLFEAGRLRRIGRTVRMLELNRGVIDMQYRDTVIDLVSSRLGFIAGSSFEIAVQGVYFNREDTFAFDSSAINEGEFDCDGFAYAPYYFSRNGMSVTDHDQGMLSLVAYTPSPISTDPEGTTGITSFPLEKLRRIKPID